MRYMCIKMVAFRVFCTKISAHLKTKQSPATCDEETSASKIRDMFVFMLYVIYVMISYFIHS